MFWAFFGMPVPKPPRTGLPPIGTATSIVSATFDFAGSKTVPPIVAHISIIAVLPAAKASTEAVKSYCVTPLGGELRAVDHVLQRARRTRRP